MPNCPKCNNHTTLRILATVESCFNCGWIPKYICKSLECNTFFCVTCTKLVPYA